MNSSSTLPASTARVARQNLKIAGLGAENPLPNIGKPLENPYRIGGGVPAEIIENSEYGHPLSLHPYQLQDQFNRELTDTAQTVVILENEHLFARFLPGLGGRLWELTEKATGKNLLHTPDQIQFGNLALRNAWFAGGIEWNIGTRGHSPSTCSPLHAAIVTTPDGAEALRMWEFDRLREVVFQIDAWLPAGSRVLNVAIRISNPNPHDVPMYWWSNAAIPQGEHTRVLAPAHSAFASDYANGIKRQTPQNIDGVDCTWPVRNKHAADFFFDLAPQQRRWIVASDADGSGLAMVSTERLRGRKLFVWGESRGGRRWQQWLNPAGGDYAEIQAGLAQTQFENLRLPAGESWSWLECYGNAALEPEAVKGEWGSAIEQAGQRIEILVPEQELQSSYTQWQSWADSAPQRSVLSGSGWGAVEVARRRRAGQDWDFPGAPFASDTVSAQERPWLELVSGAPFSGAPSYVLGQDWSDLLAVADGDAAQIALHRGVIAHAQGEAAIAAGYYRAVMDLTPNAIALRGLAVLSGELALYRQACLLEPGNRALLVEAVTAMLASGAAADALHLLGGASVPVEGRLEFLRLQALTALGETSQVAQVLKAGIAVPDVREGENSLADLWQQVCPGEEVPAQYQFTMKD